MKGRQQGYGWELGNTEMNISNVKFGNGCVKTLGVYFGYDEATKRLNNGKIKLRN